MVEQVLLVAPADMPWPAPGFTLFDAACGHRAWIAPSGVALMLGGGVTSVCEDCVDPAELSPDRFAAVPGSVGELSALFGRGVAEAVVAEVAADPGRALRVNQESHRRRRASGR